MRDFNEDGEAASFLGTGSEARSYSQNGSLIEVVDRVLLSQRIHFLLITKFTDYNQHIGCIPYCYKTLDYGSYFCIIHCNTLCHLKVRNHETDL